MRNRTSGPNRPETPNRRVLRTRAALRNALFGLAREKPYDSIAVKEILARANIGRSTFYMHFQDKDELLESGICEMLGSIRHASRGRRGLDQVVAFSRPILEHIAGHLRLDQPPMPRQGRLIMHDRLQGLLTRLIADDIETIAGGERLTLAIPADLLAPHIAATFVLVLNWWVDRHATLTPAEADDRFRALVLPLLKPL